MKRTRRRHDPNLKAKIALEAVREMQTVPELAARYGIHPTLISTWKRQLLERASAAFVESSGKAVADAGPSRELLLQKIGELTVERDFLAKGLRRLG